MKRIRLKEFKDTDGTAVPYALLIQNILQRPLNAQAGVNYQEMSEVMPIIAKVKAATHELLLEDAEFAVLKARAVVFPFGAATNDIYEFLCAVIEAEEFSVGRSNLSTVKTKGKSA